MKGRITLFFVLLAVTAGMAAAQQPAAGMADLLDIGFWGRATWAPLVFTRDADGLVDGAAGEGPGIGVGSGPAWDDIGAGMGVYLSGRNTANNAGFVFNVWMASGSTIGTFANAGDNNAYLWLTPFSMLNMRLGLFRYEEFRGRVGAVTNLPFGGDEDSIFQRVQSRNFGALFILTPPSGSPDWLLPLKAYAAFGVSGTLDSNSARFAALTTKGWGYIFAAPHAGIGYDLKDVLFARMQFIGTDYIFGHGNDFYNNSTLWFPSHVSNNAKLEFAVNVSAIENLNFDIGLGYSFPVRVMRDDFGGIRALGPTLRDLRDIHNSQRDFRIAINEGDHYQPPTVLTAAANYTMDRWTFRGRVRMFFGERVEYDDSARGEYTGGFHMEAGLEPFYDLGFARVSLPLGINFQANDTLTGNHVVSNNGIVDMNIGAWMHRSMGNASLNFGITVNIPMAGDGYFWTPNGLASQIEERTAFRNNRFMVTIPIQITINML